MKFPVRLSIRSKLVVTLLLTSIISILIVAYQGYRSAQDALAEATNNELKTLRAAKTQQIEAYFSDIRDQVLALSENGTIVDALNEFRTAFRLAGRESLADESQKKLVDYYRNQFIPVLRDRMGGEPESRHYLPDAAAARYLQYHYLAANPNEVGKKDNLVIAKGDEGYYAQVHERYHESLRRLNQQFGYYDLFLIDHETGDIVYSVFKETDFATNLNNGPYASTNLGSLAKEVIRAKERGRVRFQDYDIYTPSYGAPAAFVAVTVYDGKEIAGILALQIPSDELNKVMTSNQDWKNSGMGATGEVYLVGRNYLMRSDSRFLIQGRERYLERLRNIGMPAGEIQRIVKLNTSILFQPVTGETVNLALSGKSGTQQVIDYRGVPVMSAYAPLRTHGLDWVILAEMDIAEINEPINRFLRQVMVSASILGVVVTLLAILIAAYVVAPIKALVAGLQRVGEGSTDVKVAVTSNDEFGELTASFNTMVEGIRKQKQLIEEKDHENELLLRNILPEPIVARMRAGDEHIIDRVPNVSVIFATLVGLTPDHDKDVPEQILTRLNQLISSFDESAAEYGVEKIKTLGDVYMATCGVTVPRLDHGRRALEFAQEMMVLAQRISREYDLAPELSIGIHSGTVLAGVVGRDQFSYDVWGKTVVIADEIRKIAPPGCICISEPVYEQLHNKDDFSDGEAIRVDGSENELQTWCLNVGLVDRR